MTCVQALTVRKETKQYLCNPTKEMQPSQILDINSIRSVQCFLIGGIAVVGN